MSVAIFMDHHVPLAVTEGLRRRGVDVLTAQEAGADRFDDERLLERANQLGRVLFSQDEDLLVVVARGLQTGRDFAGLVYGPQLGLTIGKAVNELEIIAGATDPADMRSHIEYIAFP